MVYVRRLKEGKIRVCEEITTGIVCCIYAPSHHKSRPRRRANWQSIGQLTRPADYGALFPRYMNLEFATQITTRSEMPTERLRIGPWKRYVVV